MAGKFNGFSQDEINKVQLRTGLKENVKNGPTVKKHLGIRRSPSDASNNNERKSHSCVSHSHGGAAANPISKTTKPRSRPTSASRIPDMSVDDIENNPLQDAVHFKPLPPRIEPIEDAAILREEGETIELEPCNELDSSPFRGVSLKDFEQQRKYIEEQNRQKVQILQKAIEQHSQKTAAEAKKLEEIKTELAKLDTELAADVSILRKQIEQATIQYSNVQKHYDTIEQLFLKAKLDLHQACEKKELLTEHLCTIIAHNEERKAKRLTELMEKVGLNDENGN
uniref:RAB6-interacting golgin n=1 Tax=Culicoides sonorensis TaxID=179676 RepID=A0A336MPQ7_CULSO